MTRPAPGPFHCLVCRVFVTGTPSGHCPRCGFVPPHAPTTPTDTTDPTARGLWLALVLVTLLAVLTFVR